MALKMEFPELSSDDPDMNPDFCAMHGNVCSRCHTHFHDITLCHIPDAAGLHLMQTANCTH